MGWGGEVRYCVLFFMNRHRVAVDEFGRPLGATTNRTSTVVVVDCSDIRLLNFIIFTVVKRKYIDSKNNRV